MGSYYAGEYQCDFCTRHWAGSYPMSYLPLTSKCWCGECARGRDRFIAAIHRLYRHNQKHKKLHLTA